MAQDPEPVNNSAALDMVDLFDGGVESESEADIIRGILESAGIESILGESPYHSLAVQLKVPRGKVGEAKRLIEEAQAAGPQAAAEAEAQSEEDARSGHGDTPET